MKKVAISQSNYIPWKGYFDLINTVDEFIIYDDMQYTRQNWRNRNQIKTPSGLKWLTVPVATKGKHFDPINQISVVSNSWVQKHIKSIRQNYSKAKHFDETWSWLSLALEECKNEVKLSAINTNLIEAICMHLGINTVLSNSSDYDLASGKTERLVSLCKSVDADVYVSGPAARDYIDSALFVEAGIELQYIDYSNYPEYHQLHGSFIHEVTIVDLLLNEGINASKFMKSF